MEDLSFNLLAKRDTIHPWTGLTVVSAAAPDRILCTKLALNAILVWMVPFLIPQDRRNASHVDRSQSALLITPSATQTVYSPLTTRITI